MKMSGSLKTVEFECFFIIIIGDSNNRNTRWLWFD